MNLTEKYKSENLEFLINIIENKANYTDEAVETAKNEIENRNPNSEEVKSIAENLIHIYYKHFFENFSPFVDKIIPIKSYFLNSEEVLSIIKSEFDKWLDNRESYEFDVWKYSIGGVLG